MGKVASNKQGLVYEGMRERLASGEFPPGYRLNIAQIARDTGVSTIPVREALRRLEAEGWLENKPNLGICVASYSPEDWAEIILPFAILSAYATAEAAQTLRDDGGLHVLRGLNAAMRQAMEAGDWESFTSYNRDFHQRIFDSTPHPALRRSVTDTWGIQHLMRHGDFFARIPDRAARAIEEHDRLIEMIQSQAPGHEVEALTRVHTVSTVTASAEADHDGYRKPQLGSDFRRPTSLTKSR